MKKIMMAAALGAALGGNALAQSSVQVMGTIDTFAGGIKMAGDAARSTVLNSSGMTTSWFGFRGTEDLGGGLKANFALTAFLRTDAGAAGRFGGDPFWSRDANVGFLGNWGAVTVGRGLAPNFLPTILFNPVGDSFTFSPLVLHKNISLFNGTGWGATTPSDTGWANEIIYTTPNFGGLSANLHYQFGEVVGSAGPHNAGFNVLYFNGPLAATAFYERDQISNPVAPAPFTPADTKTDWLLGASYDFTMVKAFVTYGQAKSDVLVPDAKTLSLGASVPFGAGKFVAATARTEMTPGNTRRTTTVGYDYYFSKSTDLYTMLMRDSITTFSTGTSWGVGLRKRF